MKGTYTTTDDIFTATSYNQRGQVTGYALGNGLSTTRGYDDFGFPTTIQTPGIQNLEYQFDTQTGNLNWRKDVAKTLQESFTYDNLMKNRLETWQVGSGTTFTNQYSSNGNIGSKTWLGSYQYESARPHAVTGVDNTDGWIGTKDQSINYTPFNKVRTIREGDYKLEIIYGPDNQRKKTVLYRDDNSPVPLNSTRDVINWVPYKTKYFVGGIYEEELVEALTNNTSEINYVAGGDGLAAIFVKDDQGENLYYIHKDHLGSYQAVSDESGALKEELYFSPWGNRGSATTWSYPLSQNEGFYGRGFTGHEHLPEFNLINMNGRVYDPILGRFLSPDNYIQAPDYTQSLNRYSYCLNNPLKFTDPSGEFWGWFAAMTGNYLLGVADNWINKGMSLGQAFATTPIVGSMNYHPSNNTWSNSQLSAQQLPGQIASSQQSINNELAQFSGWDENEPLFSDLTMPSLELGGIELLANPLYSQAPARINYNGNGDEVLNGVTKWIDYLYTGGFSLRKTNYGKYYSIGDVFYNLPSKPMGGYSPAGPVIGRFYLTSDNNKFSISIHRFPNNNSIKGGSTFLKGMRHGVATDGLDKTYFWLFLHNGTKSGTSYNKVLQLQFYGEDFYSPIRNNIINKVSNY